MRLAVKELQSARNGESLQRCEENGFIETLLIHVCPLKELQMVDTLYIFWHLQQSCLLAVKPVSHVVDLWICICSLRKWSIYRLIFIHSRAQRIFVAGNIQEIYAFFRCYFLRCQVHSLASSKADKVVSRGQTTLASSSDLLGLVVHVSVFRAVKSEISRILCRIMRICRYLLKGL